MKNKVYIVAIFGGSGSGKTTFARKIAESLGPLNVAVIGQDSYYIDQSERFDRDGGAVNFDHPESIDFNLLKKHLEDLKSGLEISIPKYDFKTHKRLDTCIELSSKPLILVDGILIMSVPDLIPLFDEIVFIDCDEDTRFGRRLKRDVVERNRTPLGVFRQFHNQVKPMHDQFVEPNKKFANSIVTVKTFDHDLKRMVLKLRTIIST